MSENISPIDDPKLADEVLEAIDDLCRELGFTYFLYGGTCLGFVRGGDYIKDNDLDITVVSSEEEYQDLWKKLAILPGWTDSSGLRKGGIQIDLHYTDKEAPHYVIPSWRPESYIFHEFDTVYHRATRRNYNIPSPVEEYLDWEFLGTWRTPMLRETWAAIDTWLQRLLLEK